MAKTFGLFAALALASSLIGATNLSAQQAPEDQELLRDLAPEQRDLVATVTSLFPSRPKDGNPINVRLSTPRNQKSFKVGDSISLRVTVDKDSYVYVLSRGQTGNVNILFPNKHQTSARVKKGMVISIPPESTKTWRIKVSGPTGAELVVAVASTRNLPKKELDAILAELKTKETVTLARSEQEFLRDLSIEETSSQRAAAAGSHKLKLYIVN